MKVPIPIERALTIDIGPIVIIIDEDYFNICTVLDFPDQNPVCGGPTGPSRN